MKMLPTIVLSLGMLGAMPQNRTGDLGLPSLHKVTTAVLQPAYSCRSSEEFATGYGQTALFLSEYGRRHNTPDLLFNGACGSPDEFEAATAGDDMSLIADLGPEVPFAQLSAKAAFNLRGIASPQEYSRFVRSTRVVLGHTYAVLLNGRNRRGLFVMTVDHHATNKKVALRYSVKLYQVAEDSSEGFEWGRGNEDSPVSSREHR